MTRDQLLQQILDQFDKPSYLEIGVNHGVTFRAVRAARKVAVDPEFLFDFKADEQKDETATYHQVTSNKYFGSILRPAEKFDVIFLDGLHTFEQTLADFCSAIVCLSDNGVVVIDDVIPSSYHASLKDHRLSVRLRTAVGKDLSDKSWMGDVYRLVFFIADYFHQFNYATVSENHGQLVVWREQRDLHSRPMRSPEELSRLPFEASYLERDAYNVKPLSQIVRSIELARASRQAASAEADGSPNPA